jgi:CAAX prenyl protease-like protein
MLAAIVVFFKQFKELKKFKFYWSSIPIGILTILIWVGLDSFYPYQSTSEFNPMVFPTGMMITLVIFRILGAVIVASFAEEMFIRSFLIRFFVDPRKWEKVKVGTFTWLSFLITVIFFGFAHDRWLVGIITGVIFTLVLYWKKDLWACIQTHSVANLVLAIYILYTQSWGFW